MKMIKHIIAIAEKELKLDLRFKLNYLMNSFVLPFRLLFLFFFIYSGFFYFGASQIAGITKQNYIEFLVLGSIINVFFEDSFNKIRSRLYGEKFWQTIQGLLIAPINKLKYLIGFGSTAVLELLIIYLPIFIMLYIYKPIKIYYFLLIILTFIILYMGVMGMGLINSALALSKENLQFVVRFFILVWIPLSCFYYPIESLPKIIHPLVIINPIYHGNILIKSMWINGSYSLGGLIYIIIFAIISMSFGIIVFNKILKKGIEGY